MRIAVRGLRHTFPGQPPLFQGLDCVFESGILTGIVGPSGSGKSTLMSLLAGMEPVQGGDIAREGVHRLGWILQNPVGAPRRTAREQIAFALLARGSDRYVAEEEAARLLDRFQLGHVADREFRRLSGGEAQRMCFARAVASGADALLVDEPTAQLDPLTAASVRDVIRELVGPLRIVVLATHDQILRHSCDALVDLGAAATSHLTPEQGINAGVRE